MQRAGPFFLPDRGRRTAIVTGARWRVFPNPAVAMVTGTHLRGDGGMDRAIVPPTQP